jgi:hypothetical protein
MSERTVRTDAVSDPPTTNIVFPVSADEYDRAQLMGIAAVQGLKFDSRTTRSKESMVEEINKHVTIWTRSQRGRC